MNRIGSILLLALTACVGLCAEPDADSRPIGPGYDALPPGATRRLGSLRLKQAAEIASVAFSPDGKWIASGGIDGHVVIWDAATGAPLRMLPGEIYYVSSPIAISPDGRLLATGAPDNKTICLWDTATWAKCGELTGHGTVIRKLAFSPDGLTLASCSGGYEQEKNGDYSVRLWDVATRTQKLKIQGHSAGVMDVAWAHDGKRIASGSWDCTIKIWDAATGNLIQAMHTAEKAETGTEIVSSLVFTHDDARLISTGFQGELRQWDAKTGALLNTLSNWAAGWMNCVVTGKDGLTYATAASGFVIWDTATAKQLWRSNSFNSCDALAFSKDCTQLATGDRDYSVRLWDVEKRTERFAETAGHRGGIATLAFSPDGRQLATGGRDGVVIFWDVEKGTEVQRLTEHERGVQRLYWTKDCFASFSWDKSLRFWDLAAGKSTRQIKIAYEHHTPVVSADGLRIAYVSMAGDACLLDRLTGATLQIANKKRTPDNTNQGIGSERIYLPYLIQIDFISERELAAGSDDGAVYRWNLATNELKAAIKIKASGFWSRTMIVSHDKRFIACSDGDHYNVHVFEWVSGQQICEFNDAGRVLAFSRDDRLAISMLKDKKKGRDHAIQLADSLTGTTLSTLKGHAWAMGSSSVGALAFSPDGRTLASGGDEGTALLWDVAGSRAETRAKAMDAAALQTAWNDLSADAPTAFKAVAQLIGAREAAVEILTGKLAPKEKDPAITKLIVDLDSDEFAVRQKASADLLNAGANALPYIEAALNDAHSSLEVVARCKIILEKSTKNDVTPATLQALRAVMVLERIGTPSARKTLKRLAQGDERARMTQDAKLALMRLQEDALQSGR